MGEYFEGELKRKVSDDIGDQNSKYELKFDFETVQRLRTNIQANRDEIDSRFFCKSKNCSFQLLAVCMIEWDYSEIRWKNFCLQCLSKLMFSKKWKYDKMKEGLHAEFLP